jgi:hypothetical protein
MAFNDEALSRIFDRTDGRCHICGKRLCFQNYGASGRRGAWEVEHSIPRARGGTDHANNLFAACIPCNRAKGKVTTRTARRWNDRTAAPFSRKKKAKIRKSNAVKGGAIGGLLGAVLGGPVGFVVGTLSGAVLGHDKDPERN